MASKTALDWKNEGNASLSKGEYQNAVDCYTKAIELDGTNHVFYSNRSAAYLSMEKADEALKDADKCIEIKPDWVKGYTRKGAALHKKRDYEEAVKAYEDGLKVDPSNAACSSGLEEVKKAMSSNTFNPLASAFGPDMFGKIATNPRISHFLQDPEFLQKLQEIQKDPSKMNQYLQDQRVMTVLAELMGLNMSGPENGDNHQPEPSSTSESSPKPEEPKPEEPKPEVPEENLTEEELAQKKSREAADEAKARGNSFYKKKQFDEAIACYNEAFEKDPTNMLYLSNLAAVYLEKGDLDECIAKCKKAIEVGRENRADYSIIAKAYTRIGNAYLKMEETEENLQNAIDAYENAQVEFRTKVVDKKIKDTQKKLKKAKELAYIDPDKAEKAKAEGNEFFKSGEFPKAVERYTEAIKRNPENAIYYANRAAAYTKLTSFMEAKKDCEKALDLDPKYVKAWTRMAAIQFLMKEYHKARQSYEKGLEIDPNNEECKSGLQSVIARIQSGGSDEERARHGLADPEIQAILRDPVMQQVLNDFQTDPQGAQRHLQNADIMGKIEKLIEAGVLQTK